MTRPRFRVLRDASGAVAYITRPEGETETIRLSRDDLVRLMSDAGRALLYVERVEGWVPVAPTDDAPPEPFIGFAGE